MRGWRTIWALGIGSTAACGGTDPVGPEFGIERIFTDHRERDVRFASGGDTLAGTIYYPVGSGPFAVTATSLGSAWTVRATWNEVVPFVAGLGVAVLSYDKRGEGESGGSCCPADFEATLALLAGDLVAATSALRDWDEVDAARIGVFGSSQGGWVVPLAANLAPQDIGFGIVTVGGGVSTGQENLYDVLTGYNVCQRTAIPLDEIIAQLRAAGPSGFDPRPTLEAMTQPTIWIYGSEDMSHPTDLAVANLEEIRTALSKDWDIVVLDGANHDLIAGGAICQVDGDLADVLTPLTVWVTRILGF